MFNRLSTSGYATKLALSSTTFQSLTGWMYLIGVPSFFLVLVCMSCRKFPISCFHILVLYLKRSFRSEKTKARDGFCLDWRLLAATQALLNGSFYGLCLVLLLVLAQWSLTSVNEGDNLESFQTYVDVWLFKRRDYLKMKRFRWWFFCIRVNGKCKLGFVYIELQSILRVLS